MSTLKEYILQCEKAIEIQKEWEPICGDRKVYRGEETYTLYLCVGELDVLSYDEIVKELKQSYIWLPHQDQLQKILWSPMTASDMYGWLRKITEFQMKHSCQSMGQLWLSFVMLEKFSKQWDNKEKWLETRIP